MTRFLTPGEVAEIFRKDVKWIYRSALPERRIEKPNGDVVLRKAGFLACAAWRFNAHNGRGGRETLLFDRATVERIIEGAKQA